MQSSAIEGERLDVDPRSRGRLDGLSGAWLGPVPPEPGQGLSRLEVGLVQGNREAL